DVLCVLEAIHHLGSALREGWRSGACAVPAWRLEVGRGWVSPASEGRCPEGLSAHAASEAERAPWALTRVTCVRSNHTGNPYERSLAQSGPGQGGDAAHAGACTPAARAPGRGSRGLGTSGSALGVLPCPS